MNTQITLKQLETLVWIVRFQTFERAAAKLCTTQSSVSKRVQELEKAAGFEVFDRKNRSTRLTLQGEELFAIAEKMLSLYDQIVEIRDGEARVSRILRLGVTEMTAMTWLPRLISEIESHYPQVTIAPRVDMSRTLFADLEQDRVDLVIMPGAFSLPEYKSRVIAEISNIWVAKPGLIRQAGRVTFRELAEYPILIQGSLSGSGVLMNNWLKERGVVFKKTLSCDSVTALLGLAVAGLGVCYVPYDSFKDLILQGKLTPVECDEPLPKIPYVAMYRDDSSFLKSIAEIAARCADFGHSFQSTMP